MRQLARTHRVVPASFAFPLLPPVGHPLVVEGIAATADVDADRMSLAPHCFDKLDCKRVRLLFKHDPTKIAGAIEDLAYDDRGRLLMRALITHSEASRCCGLSVGFRVSEYTLHDENSFCYFARIVRAELAEISLTDIPANAACIVTARRRQTPSAELYDLLQHRIARVQGVIRSQMMEAT